MKILPPSAFEDLKLHVGLRESTSPAPASSTPPSVTPPSAITPSAGPASATPVHVAQPPAPPPAGPKTAPGSAPDPLAKSLLEAIHQGDEEKYRQLVQQFSNTALQEFRDGNKNTFLYEACRQRKFKAPCVQIITDLQGRGLTATTPSGFLGSTALHGLFQGLRKWYEAGPRTDAEVVDYVKMIRLVKIVLVASNASLATMLNYDHYTAEAELDLFLRTVKNATHQSEIAGLKK